MGSGELTSSMVEVHKQLLAGLGKKAPAVFVDTPAGFQPNVGQIAEAAISYFNSRILHPISVASYRSGPEADKIASAEALQLMADASYLLLGPGSPSYTLAQFAKTQVPKTLRDCVDRGGRLTAASAAALVMGRYTLPVYEIYKVGEPLHWKKGLNILAQYGLDLAVVPHWNNAEGGSHDTSRCFLGQNRFARLVELLEEPVPILGLDEHTACIIDLATDQFAVAGIGKVELLDGGTSQIFITGKSYPLGLLRGEIKKEHGAATQELPLPQKMAKEKDETTAFWSLAHQWADRCRDAHHRGEANQALAALLEFEALLWGREGAAQPQEILAEARDLFRELLVVIGSRQRLDAGERRKILEPLVGSMVTLRACLRSEKQYDTADLVRSSLARAGVVIEDLSQGANWHLAEPELQALQDTREK